MFRLTVSLHVSTSYSRVVGAQFARNDINQLGSTEVGDREIVPELNQISRVRAGVPAQTIAPLSLIYMQVFIHQKKCAHQVHSVRKANRKTADNLPTYTYCAHRPACSLPVLYM